MSDWFEIKRINHHLCVIRERLDKIDKRFFTKYTNMFLLLGTHSALLFDTGSSYQLIKPLVENLIDDRELIVINSHNHFDHVGGNTEFSSVHIHRFDLKKLTKPIDISFLQDSGSELSNYFEKNKYQIKICDEYKLLIGDEIFDLGDLKVQILSTPGHTQGSICLLTNYGELFTGDTVHYGAIYLPKDDLYKNYKNSLSKLHLLVKDQKVQVIYPAHEDYIVDLSIIEELESILSSYEFDEVESQFNEFLDSYVVNKEKFLLIFPKGYSY